MNSITKTPRFWQIVFLLAAVWNFAGATIAFSDLEANATTFFFASPDQVHPVFKMMLVLFWWTVFTFGVGYLIVAYNPRKNQGILIVAALGKSACGGCWILGFWNGQVSSTAFAVGIGDLAFALMFVLHLSFVWLGSNSR